MSNIFYPQNVQNTWFNLSNLITLLEKKKMFRCTMSDGLENTLLFPHVSGLHQILNAFQN